MNYKEILKNVLENGVPKQPTRLVNGEVVPVQNSTIGTFGEVFRHDMSEGFPLSGLRKLPFKSTVVELEGFMKAITDKRWFEERGCKYWSEFSSDYSRLEGESKRDHWDLGPLGYSFEWREFGGWCPESDTTDQLANTVYLLRNHPYDRRMVTSFWNPNSMQYAALPSCHILHQALVYGDTLHLHWYQRSCDIMLNASITTYALLLLMYAKVAGKKPGTLQGIFADCHLYENQIEAAKIMVERDERPLPTVELPEDFDIFNWTHDQIKLIGYDPWPAVKTGAITV